MRFGERLEYFIDDKAHRVKVPPEHGAAVGESRWMVRGPGGGYRLAQPQAELSIGRIIDAVNEHLDVTRCKGKGDCQHGDTCLTHHLWTELSDNLHQFLHRITIADLLREHAARQRCTGHTEGSS